MSDYYLDTAARVADLPLFRRDDPQTSKHAGTAARDSGLVSDHERRIIEALASGPAGKCEIARRTGLTEQQVARRRAGLMRAGRVELTGRMVRSDSGCVEGEWRAKTYG
jgi:FixJ family two-component response regulator